MLTVVNVMEAMVMAVMLGADVLVAMAVSVSDNRTKDGNMMWRDAGIAVIVGG